MNTSDIIAKIFDIKKRLISEADCLTYLNIAQKWAFKNDLEAFKVWATLATTTGTLSYSFAALATPCRKLFGVTERTDAEIFNTDNNSLSNDYDYGMNRDWTDSRSEYVPGRVDTFGQTFTFIEDPGTEATKWRWVYYRNSKDLTGTTDNTNLILPEQYHPQLINAACRIADYVTHQEAFGFRDIEPYFVDFWSDVQQQTVPMGDGSIGYSEGNLP